MNAQKTLTALVSAPVLSLITSTAAHAASTQKVYTSGILVLVFLGFCALVVIAQLIPAIVTLVSMIRGVEKKRVEAR